MKIKKVILLIEVIIFCAICNNSFASVSNDLESINKLSKIDDKIYVQHKEPDENGNIYDSYILTSEGEETTLWEVIPIEFNGLNKYWSSEGDYADESELYKYGGNYSFKVMSTTPDEYVEVVGGEEYFVRMYGEQRIYTGNNKWIHTVPILFLNDNNEVVGNALDGFLSRSKKGVTFIVPDGATKMHVTNYCNQNISIQRKMVVTLEEFKTIKEEQNKILNNLDSTYAQLKEDQIIYGDLDKAYITFVNDDTTPEIDKFADIFIERNTPLCLATVANNLPNYASNGKERRLDVALRVQQAKGEILAHNGAVITKDTIEDNDFMYNYFVVQKKLLTRMGLNVNGIILAGGSGQITGDSRSAKWVSSLYSYSDLLGEYYRTPFGIDSVYYHHRGGLKNYGNNLDEMKNAIDSIIQKKQWQVFYFHNSNEISLDNLKTIIDYINSKDTDEVEIVTYETMYEKFAARESSIKKAKKTYYVSANGTSTDGTDINNPINLNTLNTKKLKTGDTVLFKSGDTFFGTLNFKINDADNGVVTISNYGDGDLPTISTYKYVTGDWEKYQDNIYRVDISDTNNYTGYSSNETNAYNVGFLEDDAGTKYYNKKVSIDNLEKNFDFYSDGSKYLYMYIDNGNPHEKIGNVKAAVRSKLMMIGSNMDIKNIRLSYTGGHAIAGNATDLSNITIEDCIIENIGGSYLYSSSLSNDTRYGNGIEFYGSNVKDITIKNNIIRNVYDVGFTIQGTQGSGTNVIVKNNVFVSNSQDSEIWENGTATGIQSYEFMNNISVNQGRGWGYDARPDKYAAAHILFWGYNIENTDIYFHNNTVYNPRRLYFVEQTHGTNLFFKENNYIKSDYNTYLLTEEATIFRDYYKLSEKDKFISDYNKDANSVFNLIEVDSNIIQVATTSNQINSIKRLFGIEEEQNSSNPNNKPVEEEQNQSNQNNKPVEEEQNQSNQNNKPVEEEQNQSNQNNKPVEEEQNQSNKNNKPAAEEQNQSNQNNKPVEEEQNQSNKNNKPAAEEQNSSNKNNTVVEEEYNNSKIDKNNNVIR